jgi:predicted DNA-binding transcriptional regulator AlpA
MAYLNKEDLLLKLGPFGVKSVSSLNRLIREQRLPAKYISARKVFFDDAEIDIWLSRRYENVVKSNAAQVKVTRQQRKTRKNAETPQTADAALSAEVKAFKAKEA